MPAINYIDGEKGGVGKSLFAKTLVQYCLNFERPFFLVECDRSNPDVGRTFQRELKVEFAFFTENEKQADAADRIFELALQKPVIANLPAQVHRAMIDWMEGNDLIKLGQENGVTFVKWFLCSGGYDSIQLFRQSLEYYGGRIPHILVRNWGLCDDWTHVEEDEALQTLIHQYSVKVINMPKFAYAERNLCDAKSLTFSGALQDPVFRVISRQRIKSFLKQCYAEIGRTGVFEELQSGSTGSVEKRRSFNGTKAAVETANSISQ